MTPASVRKAVAAYFAAQRTMDVEAWVSTFAENAVSQDPVGSPPAYGHTALRQLAAAMWGPWDNVSLQEQEVFVSANEAAIKWKGHGRTKSGLDLRFEGIAVVSVNEQGKIENLRSYWDAASLISQISAASSPSPQRA